MKKKTLPPTTWAHHENMVINLRDWVGREINTLHRDIEKEIPHLEDEPHVRETITRLDGLRTRLFEALSDLVTFAEKESKKVAKKQPPAEKPEATDELEAVED